MSEPTRNDSFDEAARGADAFDEDAADDQLVTNDAVAGETVLEGPGTGNTGPTGGAPTEFEPEQAGNDLAGEEIDLGETPDA